MNSYQIFAEFYDRFISDVDYKKICDFFINATMKYSDIKSEIILDLGCGTGTLCCLLDDYFNDIIGVDESDSMLFSANFKATSQKKDILFINQSGENLDLFGTVDGVISTLDTINHITDLSVLQKTFDKISLFLIKGGLFIFDVNTFYKHDKVLSSNSFVYEDKDVMLVWQNFFDDKKQITSINLDFFIHQKNGLYLREEEFFEERYYSFELLKMMLEKSGLEIIGIFDDYEFSDLTEKSQRATYITKKR